MNEGKHGNLNWAASPFRLSAADAAGSVMCISYCRVADRFLHRINYLSETGTQFHLDSCVGDVGSAQWPGDPPLQQLSRETIAGQTTILAVGQAGVGHWSSSAQAVHCDQGAQIFLDVACRFSVFPLHLGSQYQVPESCFGVCIDSLRVLVQLPQAALCLEAAIPESHQTANASIAQWQWDPVTRLLRLTVGGCGTNMPQTVRWQIKVFAVSGGGPSPAL